MFNHRQARFDLREPVWILFCILLMNATPADVPVQKTKPSVALQAKVGAAVKTVVAQFKGEKLTADELAVTLLDLTDPGVSLSANHRGGVPIYPASVVKLFYLVAAHHWLETGKLTDTPELRRAMRDMIVDSSNEATHYVIDLLTDTTSGPELPPDDLAVWFEKRNAVNRYFTGLGYTGVNANKKPWNDGPYGRETQAIQAFEQKRNMLTTDATARLLRELATGQAVSAQRSLQMRDLLRRDPGNPKDEQAQFSGPALPVGAKFWSKAGWTSQTRHDAMYLELPDGRRLVLVVFTVNHAKQPEIIRSLVRHLVE